MSKTETNVDDLQSLNLIRHGGKMRDQGVAELYRKHAAHFRKYFLYQGLNATDAEDIVQETFVKIIRNCESYRGDAPIIAWLWVIARNCMNDHFDYVKRRPTENLDEEGWDNLERESEVLRTLDSLPSGESLEDCVGRGFTEFAKNFSERAHVLSLVMDGFDTAYIAAAIKRTPGATREFISQSRKRIEEFLLPCREYLSAA
jgi:RNA polymerase sigma-70 factor (ECF subfamily)